MWKTLLTLVCLEVVLALQPKTFLENKQMMLFSKLNRFESAFPKVLRPPTADTEFPETLDVVFNGLGNDFHMKLEKNTGLFSANYFYEEQEYHKDTRELVRKKRYARQPSAMNCFYHGSVENSPGSSVAISACGEGVRGLIKAHNDVFYVEPRVHGASQTVRAPGALGEHIIYRVADVNVDFKCGLEQESGVNFVEVLSTPAQPSNNKRDDTKYVEFFVANDNKRYKERGETTEIESAGIANIVDMLYKDASFNPPIRVVLVGQTTFLNADPFTPAMAGNEVKVASYLSLWNEWRSNPATKPQHHDCGHLFSGLDFEGPTIGYAGVGSMCFEASSGGINQVTFSDAHNAAVVAHEMGHNFGMQHDSVGNQCPQSGFIMGAVLSTSTFPAVSEFSTCSHDYLGGWFSENTQRAKCLDNFPSQVYGDPVCGNGFVEEGEDCDCGSLVSCPNDQCCNAATCKFVQGAVCSERDPCCTSSCQVVSADAKKICRASSGDCDLDDYCDGESSRCPDDVYEITGISCDDLQGQSGSCYLGECLSHNQQCRSLDSLFENGPYVACPFQKQLNQGNFCGDLYCTTQKESDKNTCYSFNLYGSIISTPDGVPCDKGKQCYQGKCTKSSQLPGGDPITDVSMSSQLGVSLMLLVALLQFLL